MAESLKTPAKKNRLEELTPNQKKFAELIVKLGKDRRAEAARLAGYKGDPSVEANRQLKKAKVASYISSLTAKIREQANEKAKEEAKEEAKVGTYVANSKEIDYLPGILLEEYRVQKAIADIAEIMRFKTAVMRGEIKDQFGLDLLVKDRNMAANDLYKMLAVDSEEKKKGTGESLGLLVIEPIYGTPTGDDDE